MKGNKNVGTTTDADGNFVLAYNDNKAEALNVNYIGCASMEIEVKEGEENVGTIKMSQDAYSLQDGYNIVPAQRFYYMWFCGSLDENHKRIEGLWMTLKKK